MKKARLAHATCLALCAAATSAALFVSASSAYATESPHDGTSPESVLEEVAPETLSSVADVSSTSNGVNYTVNRTTTSVSADANEGISFESDHGTVGVSLPFAENADPVHTAEDGIIAFDNGNDSTTASILKEDGGVQINTIIASPDAPTRYDYHLDLPSDAAVIQNTDGSVLISGADGRALASVAPAWAKDASGQSVDTWYEVEGNKITQVVEHSAANVYPIVADPSINVYWWGIGIKFSKAETKKIAGASSNTQALAVACGLIASAPGAVACGAAGFVFSSLGSSWAKGVASRGKCIQLSQTWATGLPAVPVEVGC